MEVKKNVMKKRKPWKVWLVAITSLWVLLLVRFSFTAIALERYGYLEQGSDSLPFEWILEKENCLKLTVVRPGETYISYNDSSCSTFQWELCRGKDTRIVAKKEKESIVILGTNNGKAVYKKTAIDQAPWYQAISLSLRPFVVSEASTVEFWTVRPDNLTLYKIKARKDVIEPLVLGEKNIEAQKVVLNLAGFKGMFWSCCYWFKKDDGLFLKYEGRDGPPKYDHTIITYIGSK